MAKVFDREIVRMRDLLLSVAQQTEEQLRNAIQALLKGDTALADGVIEGDSAIDLAEVQAEEECLKLLALHQPVANDLRLIIAGLKINNDLERVGDHAVSIARCANWMNEQPAFSLPPEVAAIAKKSKLMFRKSLLAFVEQEVELAWRVLKSDDEVDELNKSIHQWYIEWLKSNSDKAQAGLYLVSISKHFERVADLASNIAEEVIYVQQGEIVRHGRVASEEPPRQGKVIPFRNKSSEA